MNEKLNEPAGIINVSSVPQEEKKPSGKIKTFAFVAAFHIDEEDKENGLISFEHVFVEACDADEAYSIGYGILCADGKKFPLGILNDYVFEAGKPK